MTFSAHAHRGKRDSRTRGAWQVNCYTFRSMAQAEERAPVRVDRELFEQLAPGLRKRIFGYTRDWHSTEDLLQDLEQALR